MRRPIAVQADPFDIESIQPRLNIIRETFGRFLDSISIKTTLSKHGLMGSVGKILSEIRSGRSDAASLKGYALRVQEQSGSQLSTASIKDLESGIEDLVELFTGVPLAFRDQLIDRLDYGLYFDLRKKNLERKEAIIKQWHSFLLNRYAEIEKLNSAWKENHESLGDVMIQKKATGSRSKDATPKQVDVFEFWESVGKGNETLVIEEE